MIWKAVVGIVIVAGILVGGLLTLRASTRAGMPDRDVLDRAEKRARELEAEEKSADERRR